MNLTTKEMITVETFLHERIVRDGKLTPEVLSAIAQQWKGMGDVARIEETPRGVMVSFSWGWYTPRRLILTR
jgi:hypothetical protein